MLIILDFMFDIFFWVVIAVGIIIALATVLNIIQFRLRIFNNFYSPIEQCEVPTRKLELVIGKFRAGELVVRERDRNFVIFYDKTNDREFKIVSDSKSYFYGCFIEPNIIPYTRPKNSMLREFKKFMKTINITELHNVNEVMVE